MNTNVDMPGGLGISCTTICLSLSVSLLLPLIREFQTSLATWLAQKKHS
jgi:hypothetical protein